MLKIIKKDYTEISKLIFLLTQNTFATGGRVARHCAFQPSCKIIFEIMKSKNPLLTKFKCNVCSEPRCNKNIPAEATTLGTQSTDSSTTTSASTPQTSITPTSDPSITETFTNTDSITVTAKSTRSTTPKEAMSSSPPLQNTILYYFLVAVALFSANRLF